ncbi:peroxiredoxin family protein [Flavobacterium pectinovorum]|uniref:peroxiredoxin family protein n=1 Tax=Flavobacterium pectinovorum TaxID=29533 RepID=UPI001FAE013C|nr:TlpA disulfide reductase family protein [Flavobacterium pectinovorum]MCI9846846.1 TlpA family protein disulfide reductase [Flavobacterium pectinovorum]
MKKIIFKALMVILFASALSSCSEKKTVGNEFVVKGKFSKITSPVIVYLTYQDDKNESHKEEFVSKNGEFEFKGNAFASSASIFFTPYVEGYTIDQPEYWTVAAKEMKSKPYFEKSRGFFLEGGTFEFTGDDNLETAKLQTDSENQEIFTEYVQGLEKVKKEYVPLVGQKAVSDSIGIKDQKSDKINAEYELKRKQFVDYAYEFSAKYPESKVSLIALQADGFSYDFDKLSVALDQLSKDLQTVKIASLLRERITKENSNNIGKEAVDFSLEDPNGKEISLQSYRGKYVLVDFWASGCAPCRAENPNVVKAYNKFKSKNFDIISISTDIKKEPWLKAVAEDKLPWVNLIDKKERSKATWVAYGVLGIPSNFLIDPSGKIVAKNLRGIELHTKLAEILK